MKFLSNYSLGNYPSGFYGKSTKRETLDEIQAPKNKI